MTETPKIYYVDGTEEEFPESTSLLKCAEMDMVLRAYERNNYGADRLLKSYSLYNVKSWDPIS